MHLSVLLLCFSIFCSSVTLGAPPGSSLKFTNDVNDKEKVFVDHFYALPAELKKIILVHLSIEELFDFAQIADFKEYRDLAAEAYGSTHSNSIILVKGYEMNRELLHQNNMIQFKGFKTFSTFLSTFKKYVKNVRIDFSRFDRLKNERGPYLNEIELHSAKSLNRIEIRRSNELDMKHIATMSFPNVEEVAFFGCFFGSYSTLDLRNVFPNVQRLSATFVTFSDRRWVNNSFPNLTQLQIDIHRDHFHDDDIVSILNANNKIHTLGIIECTSNLLREIDENYSNIVNLGLTNIPDELATSFDIHLSHVRRFRFKGMLRSEIPITFDRLIELQWHSRAHPDVALLPLIQEHKNTIEMLYIEKTILSDDDLIQMHDMPRLEKMVLHFESGSEVTITAKALLDLLEANENLTEIQIINANQLLRKDLYEHFHGSNEFGRLQVFNPNSAEDGEIHLVRRPYKAVTRDDPLAFLRNNFL